MKNLLHYVHFLIVVCTYENFIRKWHWSLDQGKVRH